MTDALEDRGWELWARGGECYLQGRGDDRVMASAEIDGHAEGLPQPGHSVFIALYQTQIGPEVAALLGGYAGGIAPVKYATVTWGDFLTLDADLWYHYLRGLEMADVEAQA